MNRICIKPIKTHNGKTYKKDDVISDRDYLSLTFREREHFQTKPKKVKVEGIGNDYANEL